MCQTEMGEIVKVIGSNYQNVDQSIDLRRTANVSNRNLERKTQYNQLNVLIEME